MAGQLNIFFFVLCLNSIFAATAHEFCNPEDCQGPLKFYKSMKCQPIYKNPDDCCAIKYDCEHLENRPLNKCYLYGDEYHIGESLNLTSAHEPCLHSYSCQEDADGIARFMCDLRYPKQFNSYCLHPWFVSACNIGPELCSEPGDPDPETSYICQVNGEIIEDGHHFIPENEPHKDCWCGPAYEGENVWPFCIDRETRNCEADVYNSNNVGESCTPVYRFEQQPQVDDNIHWICPNGDVWESAAVEEDPENVCRLGGEVTPLGHDLFELPEQSNSYCIKCVCEVPPVFTCYLMTPEICEVQKHWNQR